MSIMDLSAKPFAGLTLNEVMYLHVAGRQQEVTSDFLVISSLEQIVSSMRSANSRTNSQFYGPAMCAFAILDQLGTCYDRTSSQLPNGTNSIKRTLQNFCGISATSAEAQHLYAFRNGQMHDASYVNQDTRGNWYVFRHEEQLSSVIKLPNVAWDGQASTLGPDTTTLISRVKLVELASDAVREIRDVFETNPADLRARVSQTELMHKYLLWMPKTP
ncbi:hypothetical protein ABID58_006348 [Bradyrhizobium sp. S3.2.6]|uniref:hypothetical protein n=1 Tax=Bradyrhizobium sp. S3.2.6 TaxID=3156428 RepID=UPI00339A8AA8